MDVNPAWLILWFFGVLVFFVCLYLAIATFISYRRRKFDAKPPSKRRPWRP